MNILPLLFAVLPVALPLEPTLLGELDYRTYPRETEGQTGFGLGRFRAGLNFTPAPWMRATGTLEFAGEAPQILDIFARFKLGDDFLATVGYSKPPLFASFVYEPVHTLPFPDRAAVVTSFRIRRDLGADLHLLPKRAPIEAWVRVGNGTGSALGNDNALPAIYGAADLVLGRPRNLSESEFWGLRVGFGGMAESARDRDGVIGQTPLGFMYFRPVVVSGLRRVLEAHLVAYAGPLRLTFEGAWARENRSRDDDGNPTTPRLSLPAMDAYGATGEVVWTVWGAPRLLGQPPQGQSWGWGALELGVRYDGLWLGRNAADVRAGGSQGGAWAVKWWPTPFLAATLFGYFTRYDQPALEAPENQTSYGLLARLSFFWGQASGGATL